MLEERSIQILKIILESSYVFKQEIMQKCDLTRRQLEYSIDKINDWIKNEHHIPIHFIGDQVTLDSATYAFLLETLRTEKNAIVYNYVLNNQERVNFLFFMIISNESYLSVEHFVDALHVSKSTIFKDINGLKNQLNEANIRVNYNRKSGYFLEGKEITIRNNLLKKILKCISIGYIGLKEPSRRT